jgi:CheY-like chemotaxis protein
MRTFSRFADSHTPENLELARILIVHGDLAPRLALKTILQAGGYAVDVAATPAEALVMMDEGRYELVLSDPLYGSGNEGGNVLAYARIKDYVPATALILSDEILAEGVGQDFRISVRTDNVAALLATAAELIGRRASRKYRPAKRLIH